MVKVCCLGKSERKPRARLKFYVRPEIFLPNNFKLIDKKRPSDPRQESFLSCIGTDILFSEQLGWIVCIVAFYTILKYGLFFMIFIPVHVGLLWGCILSVWNILIS